MGEHSEYVRVLSTGCALMVRTTAVLKIVYRLYIAISLWETRRTTKHMNRRLFIFGFRTDIREVAVEQ